MINATGSDFRVDRIPAVAVPPLEPIIQGQAVSQTRLVKEPSAIKAGYFAFADNKPAPHQTFKGYDSNAEPTNMGQEKGVNINFFA